MAFFRNDAINRVYVHSTLVSLAQNAGYVFLFVFLLQAGVPVPLVLLAQAGIVAGRFAIRPLLLPFARRYGLKPVFVAGALGMSLQYPLLAQVRGPDLWLLALIAAAAAGEVFYYAAYNAYVSAVGDAEHRGKQVAANQALTTAAGIAAPVLAGWSLASHGPAWTFAAVAVVQAASALPLLGAPNVAVADEAPGAWRAARTGALIIAVDGWFDTFYLLVWQIALFTALKQSFEAYGGAMALAGLASAGVGLLLGRHIDAGGGRRAVVLAYVLAGGLVALKSVSLDHPWLAVAAHAAGALLWPLLIPALATAVYNLAKVSPCPLRFQLAAEGGWDVGCFLACLTAAGLWSLGVPFGGLMLLALPSVAGAAALLWRLYPARGGLTPAPPR